MWHPEKVYCYQKSKLFPRYTVVLKWSINVSFFPLCTTIVWLRKQKVGQILQKLISTELYIPIWLGEIDTNKNTVTESDLLLDKFLLSPRIKSRNSQQLILDGVESEAFLSQFAELLRRKIT